VVEPCQAPRVVRFGLFEADLAAGELRKNGRRVRLQDRPFEILSILLERPGEVIRREEFRERLWPSDTFVDFDHSLNASINKLRQALDDQADNPRFVATAGRRGYKFIAPIVAEDRPQAPPVQTTPQVDAALVNEFAAPSQEYSVVRPRHWHLLAVGLALAITIILVIWIWVVGRLPKDLRNRTQEVAGEGVRTSAALRPRRSFAVFGLKNLSGKADEAWLSTALSEMLTTELAAGEQLRAVPGEKVTQAKIDLGLPDEDGYSPGTLARIRANLGTDLVVFGSYTALGPSSNGRIRVDLRMQEAATGETVVEVANTGTESDLFELVSQAGAHLREKLGVSAPSNAEAASVRASLPANPEAARLYAEGLAKLRVFDALVARDLLREAVAAEPSFPLSHSALASAWSLLGHDGKAREEAELAYKLSEKLSRQDRLWVEGQYWETEKQWGKAVDVYKTLFAFFPDNLDYGLRLAQAQDWAGSPKDMASTLEVLRKLPPPLGTDPRIDALEASVFSPPDYTKALAAADRAVKGGSALGERLLVAQARGSQCSKLLDSGQTNEAAAACREAKQIYDDVGDRNGVGKELNNLAVLLYQQGNLLGAKQLWQEALANFREIGNDEGVGTTLMNIGAADYLQGNLAEADRKYHQALLKYREAEDKDGEARTLGDLGQLLTEQGYLEAAKLRLQQALAITQAINDRSVSAYVLCYLGDGLVKERDFSAARNAYEQSLAIRNEIGEKASAAEARIGLADLAIEEGHAADAEKPAVEARSEFHEEGQADDELIAGAVLAKALLAQGRSADAKAIVDSSSTLAAKSQNRGVNLKFAIVAARVHAANADSAMRAKASLEALRNLQSSLAEAQRLGFFGLELDARLAMGEIEMKCGRSGAGSKRLAELEKIAQAKGYALIARKAVAARA
jgi:DNA-binding winged helix-turn-helix (wHTH) protein/tetratricopeptide (TPR) repeat protein